MGDKSFLPQRRSVRLKGYDYSKPSAYFLTICTRDKKQMFGSVKGDRMIPNTLGNFVSDCWMEIPDHFRHVELAAHVVMPNHVHGIIILRANPGSKVKSNNRTPSSIDSENIVKVERRAQDAVSLRPETVRSQKHGRNFLAMHAGSIAAIVRSFKSASTKRIRQALRNPRFNIWQRGYYEHVIRDEDDFRNSCDYVRTNPARWSFDEEDN
jgi:REP element-mobilizing transposase RayT